MFLVPRVNTVDGLTQEHINKWRWNVNKKGWVNWPDYQTRIIQNSPKIKWQNKVHEQIISGKAGRTRWLGRRPKVRGVVMNPVDHPHGGGEGKTSGGRHPVSPWGQPAKGFKTRRKNKKSNEFIIKRRK